MIATLNGDLKLKGPTGYYSFSKFAYSYDNGTEYLVRAIPTVELLQGNTFYKAGGTIVTLRGTSFSQQVGGNVVTFDDLVCTVLDFSSTHITCQLPEKTTTTTSSYFVGGLGARVKAYSSGRSGLDESDTPIYETVFTDLDVERNAMIDTPETRVVETWFVPPQDGNYTFLALCDDYCEVHLSTTDMDPTAATQILATNSYTTWREYLHPVASVYESSPQDLIAGNHYYMKIYNTDAAGGDHMTIGMRIEDNTTSHENSESEWKTLKVNPNQVFEIYEVEVPNPEYNSTSTDYPNYRIQFINSLYYRLSPGLINSFCVESDKCKWVSTRFTANSTASQFKNAVKGFFNNLKRDYGNYMVSTKVSLDADGNELNSSALVTEIYSYKFKIRARHAVSSQSTSSYELINVDNLSVVVGQLVQNSTKPLSGKFVISLTRSNMETVETRAIERGEISNIIEREIYRVAPELIGVLEIKKLTSTYLTGNEGVQLVYRVASGYTVDLQIISSTSDPLIVPVGENETEHSISYSSSTYMAGSNRPFYETIPAAYLRTFETAPQAVVVSNGLRAICSKQPFCDIEFIENVAEITGRTEATSSTKLVLTFTGTGIPTDELATVSVSGLLRSCVIDYGATVSATSLTCNLLNPIAGSHEVLVQTKKGAIPNGAGVAYLEVGLQVDSVTPIIVTENGGTFITIQGDFFPLSLQEGQSLGSNFSMTLGGSECSLVSVGRNTIIVESPAGLAPSSSPTFVVTLNGKTYSHGTTFTVTAAPGTVSSVSPVDVSPPVKQDLTITVDTLPSSTAADYVGLLSVAGEEIFMKVNAINTTANTLTVRFPGTPGNNDYTVFVLYNNQRYNSSVTLSSVASIEGYIISPVDGTSKTEVSTTGGDIITITGKGFVTDPEGVIVQFGDITATTVSSTETSIVLKVPRAPSAGETEIKVFIMLSVEARCDMSPGCNITYASDQAPSVDDTTLTADVDNKVTITGSGFGSSLNAYLDVYTQTILSSNATHLEIQLSSIAFRDFTILDIQTDNGVGLPLISVGLSTPAAVLSISPNVGSSGGQLIKLSTIGIGLNSTSDHMIYYTSSGTKISICQSITVIDSNNIECMTNLNTEVPASSLISLSYKEQNSRSRAVSSVTLTCGTASSCFYETSASQTPNLTATVSGSTYTGMISGYTFDSSMVYTVTVMYGSISESGSLDASTGAVTATFANGIPPGTTTSKVMFATSAGDTFYSTPVDVTVAVSATSTSVSACSWAGGCSFTISQSGILEGVKHGGITVDVCHDSAEIDLDASTADSLVVIAPPHITSHSLSTYNLIAASSIKGTNSSNPSDIGSLAFDGIPSTQFKSGNTTGCYLQVDFGTYIGKLDKVKYFMNRMTDKQTNFVGNIAFQYYNTSSSSYEDSFTVDGFLREGWNEYTFTTPLESSSYRFSFVTAKSCQMGEVELWGYVLEDSAATSKTCEIFLNGLGSGSSVISGASVTYTDAATTTVTDISPTYGTYKGGETITITGTSFSTVTSEISVLIDDVSCAVSAATATSITCVTGERTVIPSEHSTIVSFSGATQNGYASKQDNEYIYANYWTDIDTWSGEFMPADGDSVAIPAGQTLIVDIDRSPKLKAVIVQGAMIFVPDADETHQRTFDAEYIYVDEGAKLEIGTEAARYTSKLTITMHGARESPQLPIYGNKGIFVRRGTLDIHGKERDYSWAELGETVAANSDTITLLTQVDWQVDECIVIAPTDFEADHSEEF